MEPIGQTTIAQNEAAPAAGGLCWRRLRPAEWAVLAFLAGAVLLMAAPRLPPGVCTADAGDLQLSATVLGIPHPPGYAAYVSLAHLATYVPGVDPAYLVSVCCMVVGVIVVVLCALLGIRLGAHAWTAGAIALALTGHSRFWQNLTTPEVYIFSIAFLAGSVYALARYARTGKGRSLYLAAFLYGVAMVNRPPILMAAPFFIAGWWIAKRPWAPGFRGVGRSLAGVLAAALLPAMYSFGYLYVRDTPHARYNYIEQHNAESGELPDAQAGPAAKGKRVIWMATGKQFHYRAGNTWKQVRAKFRWLRYELAGYGVVAPTAVAMMALMGVVVVFRRCPAAAVALCGVAVQGLVFIVSYQDFGQAADSLPLLIPLTVFVSAAVSVLFPIGAVGLRRGLSIAFAMVIVLHTVRDVPKHANNMGTVEFLRTADLATFPPDSVIFSHWTHAVPLLYEREVHANRRDIEVVIAQPINWLRMAERFEGRPIFVVRSGRWVRGREVTPFRNVWRLGTARETATNQRLYGAEANSSLVTHFVLTEGLGKVVDHVEGGHGPSAEFFGGVVAGQAVQIHSQYRRFERGHLLSQQGSNDAGEHIARPGRGHPRVAGFVGVEPRAVRHDGPAPLQHDGGAVGLNQGAGRCPTRRAACVNGALRSPRRQEPSRLARVRGQDHPSPIGDFKPRHARQKVQAICVHHHRALELRKQLNQHRRVERFAQSRPDGDNVGIEVNECGEDIRRADR